MAALRDAAVARSTRFNAGSRPNPAIEPREVLTFDDQANRRASLMRAKLKSRTCPSARAPGWAAIFHACPTFAFGSDLEIARGSYLTMHNGLEEPGVPRRY